MLNITKEQAKYILANYAPIRGHGKITNHKGPITETLAILRGQPVHMGCNCELPALARITSDMFEQYKNEIEAIANQQEVIDESQVHSGTKKRGRRTSKENPEGPEVL